MIDYIIAQNRCKTETILVTRDGWNNDPRHRYDIDNKPMIIMKKFKTRTWEKALEIKEFFLKK